MLIGYAYASAEDREGVERQLDALRAAGCERCYADAGPWRERPELDRALSELCDGHDDLVVCRLDRVGRSLRDLIATVAELEERGIGFCSLEDGIETAGSSQRPIRMFSRTPWAASEITARCRAARHDPAETPSPGCGRTGQRLSTAGVSATAVDADSRDGRHSTGLAGRTRRLTADTSAA